jgi:non-heme chloroperoxidase
MKGETFSPPVVMIHGAFCGGWAMQDFAEPFARAGYSVSTPDLRLHRPHLSDSELKALGTTSLQEYAADLMELIAGLPEKPILVGHSMGGLVAQMLAAQGHAKALVLLAPSAPWGVMPGHWNAVASAFGLYFTTGPYWEQPLTPVFDMAGEHALHRLSRREQESVFDRFVPESGRAVFETMHWWLDFSRASEVSAGETSCPVLCAVGAEDRVNPPELVRRIAGRYGARADYREYAKMSHWLIGEPEWEDVAADALAWLGSVVKAA